MFVRFYYPLYRNSGPVSNKVNLYKIYDVLFYCKHLQNIVYRCEYQRQWSKTAQHTIVMFPVMCSLFSNAIPTAEVLKCQIEMDGVVSR